MMTGRGPGALRGAPEWYYQTENLVKCPKQADMMTQGQNDRDDAQGQNNRMI